MIDQATEQKIKDAADIVDVVSDYVHLVRRGANYMGLCPFHNERTPSFSVNKAKNFCYCFSCHKGGSPVNFIMQKEGVSYHDALLQLAKRYGIKVEEKELSPEEQERRTLRESLLMANEWAMKLMENDLENTDEGKNVGLSYLYQRGVTKEAIRHFHLGYSLDEGQHLVNAARAKGFDLNIFKQLGLIGMSQHGREYDRFHGRVMFPILNSSGKVIAFGGRDLKGGPAKYINSPESELYKKSNELYGMFQARQAIVKEDRCFLVEGYLDVIGMWQSGMRNVIASSGTALTDGQIALIHRFTSNVTLIYDGDAAGIKASLRGIDMLLAHDMDIKLLLLPDGHDPDSFARVNTPEQFRQYVKDNETDIIRFKARILMEQAQNDPSLRARAVQSVIESIACISNKVKRDIYVQECASIMGVPEDSISLQIQKVRPQIIENIRRNREREKIDLIPDENSSGTSDASQHNNERINIDPASVSPQAPVNASRINQVNSMIPLEREIIKYTVRYGLTDFCLTTNEQGEEYILTVVEYINDEMIMNNISFSHPPYLKIFDRVKSLLDQFQPLLIAKEEEINREFEQRRQEVYNDIASRGLDMHAIEAEEKKLELTLEQERDFRLNEFARNYPSTQLASDIDDEIRNTVTELITEPHELSKVYQRNGMVTNAEDDLYNLIPRAIREWKAELLERNLKELLEKLRDSDNMSDEEVLNIQREINKIFLVRSGQAKDIGERILAPKRYNR